MVCNSHRKHLPQRLLIETYQLSESQRNGISDCKPCYPCPFFGESGRDQAEKQHQFSQDSLAH